MINNNFFIKKIDKNYMIIPLNNNDVDMTNIYTINEIGYLIYNMLKDNKSIDDIKNQIKEEYDILDDDIIINDIKEFILELKKRNIYLD
jgi:hypothetical protein